MAILTDRSPERLPVPIERDSADSVANSVVNRIAPETLATLSASQLAAVHAAIRGHQPKRHAFEWRGVVPVFFARFYLVVLAGRDRYSATRRTEAERRRDATLTGRLAILAVALSPVLLLVLFVLYVIKTALGINFLPEMHLSDFF